MRAEAASYYLADGLGSTTQFVSSSGALTGDSYLYDVFGAPRTGTVATTPNDFRFTGQQQDGKANRGLYYLRARHYDPQLGRFLGRDPVPFAQRHAYVGNNPANFTDPSGFCEKSWSIIDKLDCPKAGAQWAIDWVRSPWNQANFVQGLGYALTLTCETGVGCGAAAVLVGFAWGVKLAMACNDVREGRLNVHEASKKYIVSLVPSPPGFVDGRVIGGAGKWLLNKAMPKETVFKTLSECVE